MKNNETHTQEHTKRTSKINKQTKMQLKKKSQKVDCETELKVLCRKKYRYLRKSVH